LSNYGEAKNSELSKEIASLIHETVYKKTFDDAARKICDEIRKWTGDIQRAEIARNRWIWELFQNAIDCGKERGKKEVRISIELEDGKLVFKHNGGYFTHEELQALIFGRSTKERKRGLLGRFALGFMVTHILSRKIDIEGDLLARGRLLRVRCTLDRSGDKNDLRERLERLENYITIVSDNVHQESETIYTYYLDDNGHEIVKATLKTLINNFMVPLVMAILASFSYDHQLPYLREVDIRYGEEHHVYILDRIDNDVYNGFINVSVKWLINRCIERHVEVILCERNNNGKVGCALIRVDATVMSLLTKRTPKIWCPLPLVGRTEEIGVPIIIYGDFEPTPDRDTIMLNPESSEGRKNRRLIEDVVKCISYTIETAITNNWADAHKLAFIRYTNLSDENERKFWNRCLVKIVKELYNKPIVRAYDGRFVKPSDPTLRFISPFIEIPKRELSAHEDELDKDAFMMFWQLVKELISSRFFAVTPSLLPHETLAYDWYLIIKNWAIIAENLAEEKKPDVLSLVDKMYSVDKLCMQITMKANQFEKRYQRRPRPSDINLTTRHLKMLIDILNRVKDLAKNKAEIILRKSRILYNQGEELRYSKDLLRDPGIPTELKNIAGELGCNVREVLLHTDLDNYDIVKQVVDHTMTIQDVVDRILTKAPKSSYVLPQRIAEIWARFLVWFLLENPEKELIDEYLTKVPIITREGTAEYAEKRSPVVLAPLQVLRLKYEDRIIDYIGELYPKGTIMSELYLKFISSKDQLHEFLKALCARGIITDEILVRKKECEIGYDKLREIVLGERIRPIRGTYTIKVTSGPDLQDIVFLEDALLGAISGSRDKRKARLLIKLLIRLVLAGEIDLDHVSDVLCTYKDGEERQTCSIYPFLWLATLRKSRWVPVNSELLRPRDIPAAKIQSFFEFESNRQDADIVELRDLVVKNEQAIRLLGLLGFDVLDLKIRQIAVGAGKSGEKLRRLLIETLDVNLVETLESLAKIDPKSRQEVLNEITAQLERRSEEIRRNIEIGRVVEHIIKEELERLKERGVRIKEVKVRHIGADIEVWPTEGEGWDIGRLEVEVRTEVAESRPFLIEVKFTSGKRVRLSETQAKTAMLEGDRYLILVVTGSPELKEKLATYNELEDEERDKIRNLIVNNSHIIENIYQVLNAVEQVIQRGDVVPDIKGYWLKDTLWKTGKNLVDWATETFGVKKTY